MTDYDDLFTATTTDDSVFADKAALDPLAESDEIRTQEAYEVNLDIVEVSRHGVCGWRSNINHSGRVSPTMELITGGRVPCFDD